MAAARQLNVVQPELDVETDAERDAEASRQIELRVALMNAFRAVVREMGGNDEAARKLDSIWGRDDVGRGVSGSTFRAALGDTERNYFRLEWLFEFANRSETVRDLCRAIADGRGPKDPRDELRDLQEEVRKQLPLAADAMIKKARLKRGAR